MSIRPKVLVIGLDCATPQLVFGDWLPDLPNIQKLVTGGVYGKLKSCVPPITCPAWMVSLTSKSPGRLGVYGFRNRSDYTYEGLELVSSRSIKEDTVWDVLGRADKKSILIGIPGTYPTKAVNGWLIADFLTPNTQRCQYTEPAELKSEVEKLVGEYLVDVKEFRTDQRDWLLKQIYEMTEKRFKVADYLLTTKEWDFFMMVEIGVDRIHHSFWKFMDENHPGYVPGNPYQNVIKEYYQYVDQKIGQLLKHVDENTLVIIMSDHGAKKMDGGFALNQWLMEKGYLVLHQDCPGIRQIQPADINWQKTRLWASGGYYGRIFFNVAGREPQGIVPPEEFETLRQEIIRELKNIPAEDGRALNTKVFRPEDVYAEYRNFPPDLIFYMDDLNFRVVGSVGYESLYVYENDTGPDDANHAEEGILIMHGKGTPGERTGLNLVDIAPTILQHLQTPIPTDWEGKIIS